MLSRFFHAWEHRLASATTDRLVRPFDWGVDWLTINHADVTHDGRVDQWIHEVMLDTDAFFAIPPTTDYELTNGTLRFPSAFRSPHPENNTVVARWFPADGPKRRAVVVLPQWN